MSIVSPAKHSTWNTVGTWQISAEYINEWMDACIATYKYVNELIKFNTVQSNYSLKVY